MSKKIVQFRELEPGAKFKLTNWGKPTVWIKIVKAIYSNSALEINAINIESGSAGRFNAYDEVIPWDLTNLY